MRTNEKRLKALVKDLDKSHTLFSALLRERIVKIMEITINSIETEPEKWNQGIVHPDMYKMLDTLVNKHLGFEDND